MKVKLVLISEKDVDQAKLLQLKKDCLNLNIPLVEEGMRWDIAEVQGVQY